MRNNYLILAIFSFLLSFMFYPLLDVDFSVDADGAGNSLGIVGYGNFHLGFSMTSVSEPSSSSEISSWTYVDGQDYIAFRDSTTDPGFRMQLYMSSTDLGNFVYEGASNSQGNIDVSNFKLWGNYSDPDYFAPDMGVDDSTKTLNILSGGSCESSENLYHYDFAETLLSAGSNYAMTLSNSPQNYLVSDNDCEVEGHVEIQRMELLVPAFSNDGLYKSTLIFLILDGTN